MSEILTSKNNPLISRLSKLRMKKYRDEEGLFVFDGEKLFSEAVKFDAKIEYVVVSEEYYSTRADFINDTVEKSSSVKPRILTVSAGVFEKLTTEKSPQGIITVAKTIDFFEKNTKIYNNESFFDSPRSCVMLCDLRDPGNLGAALRSACAFELDAVFVDNGCVELFSPKTVRASMGALFKAPIRNDFDTVMQIRDMRKRGVKVYAAALDRSAVALDELRPNYEESVCFVIGNEGHGLDDSVVRECDKSVFIPMAQNTESLNASVASSILMWELFKRKRK